MSIQPRVDTMDDIEVLDHLVAAIRKAQTSELSDRQKQELLEQAINQYPEYRLYCHLVSLLDALVNRGLISVDQDLRKEIYRNETLGVVDSNAWHTNALKLLFSARTANLAVEDHNR